MKQHMHVVLGDKIQAVFDRCGGEFRYLEGEVLKVEELEGGRRTLVTVITSSDTHATHAYYKEYNGQKTDTFAISYVKKILEHSTKKLIKKTPNPMDKAYLTSKRNVWFGPIVSVACAILQTQHQTGGFQVDDKKFFELWTKAGRPGLIRLATPSKYTGYPSKYAGYLKARKFKHWVLKNAYRIRRSLKQIRAEWQKADDRYAAQYWKDVEEEWLKELKNSTV